MLWSFSLFCADSPRAVRAALLGALVIVLLTACTSSGSNKDLRRTVAPTTTQTSSATRSTGIASVDALVSDLLARDLDKLVNAVRFENMACVAEPSESHFGPQCPLGTPEGAPLPTFPFGFCSGGVVTSNDDVRQGFSAAFSSSAPTVYAVVKAGTVKANTENARNAGYSIVLDPGTPPSSTIDATAWILDLDGHIVEVDFGCGSKTPAELVEQQYAGYEFLLAPPSPETPVATVSLEPTDAKPSALTCDQQFGVTRVNQLFSALNQHDLQALTALFPGGDSGWDFEIQPDVLLAASGDATTSDIDVTSHHDLDRIMAEFVGFHLVFTSPLEGGMATETNPGMPDRQVVAIGPVLWRGTSPSLTERSKAAVSGGGKTAIDCTTGLFEKVLLSPLAYSP